MSEHTIDNTDPLEAEIARLRAENESLQRRLELRAVENRALVCALDTIGMCAHAQGRRLTVAVLTIADANLERDVGPEMLLVSDAAYDEAGLGRALFEALAPRIEEMKSARAMHPAAENLLEVMLALDEDGLLESTYNVDPEAEHVDVREDSVPPLEAAIYLWRAAGRPISADEGVDEPEDRDAPPANVVRFPGTEQDS